MLKVIQTFLDRLAERIIVIAARLVSSSVESLHATHQAEQQSRLEDLARQYETDGKTDIAAKLRERAARLTCLDPAEESVTIIENVVDAHLTAGDGIEGNQCLPPHDAGRLPDFSDDGTNKSRRKRPRTKNTNQDS